MYLWSNHNIYHVCDKVREKKIPRDIGAAQQFTKEIMLELNVQKKDILKSSRGKGFEKDNSTVRS